MGLIIFIAIIVLLIMWGMGVFKKPATCKHCGNTVKGIEQYKCGKSNSKFLLCYECYKKVNKKFVEDLNERWTYEDYLEYFRWEEEMEKERENFAPDVEYGTLKIDTQRKMFCITGGWKGDLYFHFKDMLTCNMHFDYKKTKEGLLTTDVVGDEILVVDMKYPNVHLKEVIKSNQYLRAEPASIFGNDYEYKLDEEFLKVQDIMNACWGQAANYGVAQILPREVLVQGAIRARQIFGMENTERFTEEELNKRREELILAQNGNVDTDIREIATINEACMMLLAESDNSNKSNIAQINAAYTIMHVSVAKDE